MRLIFIDTTSLISKYHIQRSDYPDIAMQNEKDQIRFIDIVLSVSNETWKIVLGHHPIYAHATKDEIERLNLQQKLDPILRKYKVDFYISGHIHNFQHIIKNNSSINCIVNIVLYPSLVALKLLMGLCFAVV